MKDKLVQKEWISAAVQAAKNAAAVILDIYNRPFEIEYKKDRSPVTEADKNSSRIILNELKKTGIPVISEEEIIPDFEVRKNEDYIWIVDPLDGTKEFIRKNGEFCICIALVYKGNPIFGLIASPTSGFMLIGGKSIGAFYFPFDSPDYFDDTHKVPHLSLNKTKTVAYSRSHFSQKAQRIMDSLTHQYGPLQYIKKGSALKFIDLALGKADFYPRLAPTMEWDIAAGQAIYEAVGGEVLDFTNFEPLQYNKADLYNPFFIAKNKDLTFTLL